MNMQRRYLPSLSGLLAFEAVSRLNSVTEAASELGLTQSAVTRQIQNLETLLGVVLFERKRKRLFLTPQGRAYADEVLPSVNKIADASLSVATNPHGGTLELAVLPAFGTHWLAPKLKPFLDLNSGIALNMTTNIDPFEFSQSRFHAAIHFGYESWPNTHALKLMDETLVPVVSPRLLHGSALSDVQQLEVLPLLHLRSREGVWNTWFKAQGRIAPKASSIGFDQFSTLIQAVIADLGAALIPKYLVEHELISGRLVTVEAARPADEGSYFLVWPESTNQYPPLLAFREWLTAQAPD